MRAAMERQPVPAPPARALFLQVRWETIMSKADKAKTESAKTENADRCSRRQKAKHEQELLDEALDESFPASDPPALIIPHGEPGDDAAPEKKRGAGRGSSAKGRRKDQVENST